MLDGTGRPILKGMPVSFISSSPRKATIVSAPNMLWAKGAVATGSMSIRPMFGSLKMPKMRFRGSLLEFQYNFVALKKSTFLYSICHSVLSTKIDRPICGTDPVIVRKPTLLSRNVESLMSRGPASSRPISFRCPLPSLNAYSILSKDRIVDNRRPSYSHGIAREDTPSKCILHISIHSDFISHKQGVPKQQTIFQVPVSSSVHSPVVPLFLHYQWLSQNLSRSIDRYSCSFHDNPAS